MELKFVDVPPDLRLKTRTLLREMIVELKNHPNKWAEFPLAVPNAVVVSTWRKAYPEFSFRATGGNNLNNADPNKKLFTIYIRYNKTEEN